MTIRIDRFGDKKLIAFVPYAGGLGPELCKRVHGGRWSDRHKGWTFPLEWSTCLELRKFVANGLDTDIKLEPAMQEWAVAEKARQADLPDLLQTTAVPLPIMAKENPKLYNAMMNRPFQTRAVLFSAKARTQLIAHEPGLGKTLSAIGSQIEGQVRGLVLVIAPNSAVNITWPDELAQWVPDDYIQIIGPQVPADERDDLLDDLQYWAKENPDKRCWVIMNPFWIRLEAELDDYGKYVYNDKGVKIAWAQLPGLFQIEWSAIICDESHETLACSTGNAKKWSQQRTGLGALKTKPDAIRLSLSGTPMRGRPENLFGQLAWLRPDVYKSYWKWVERHFHMFESGSAYGSGRVIGALKDPQAFYEEAAIVMNRITKIQVAPDLPPKTYGGTPLKPDDPDSVWGVWLPMVGKQATAYNKMAQAAQAELDGGHRISADGILAEMTRLKQFAGSYLKYKGIVTKKVVTNEWKAWSKLRAQIADIADAKALYLEEDHESQADLLYVPELPPQPEKYEEVEVEEPAYEASLPSNKFDWIYQFCVDLDIVGDKATGKRKIIIASQFTTIINLFSAELEKKKVRNYKLTGETSMANRRKMVHDFQRNPDSPKVFFLNTRAGGTALTLDAADDVIIIDETFVHDEQLQVEDRAHRLSRPDHKVSVWYLRSLGTLEETIGSTNTGREALCKGIMDGSRGMDISKLKFRK